MSSLKELLTIEQARRGLTDQECADEIGTIQQTYNSWKRGTQPRANAHPSIARFLRMKVNKLRLMLAEEAESEPESQQVRLENIGDSVTVTRPGGAMVRVTFIDGGLSVTVPTKRGK